MLGASRSSRARPALGRHLAACVPALAVAAASARAQEVPPCPSAGVADLRVAHEPEAGRLTVTWSPGPCRGILERSDDPAFPAGRTVPVTDPFAVGAPPGRAGEPLPAGTLVHYRLRELDPAWPFWEACGRSSAPSGGAPVFMAWDDDVPWGAIPGLDPGDAEAVHFVPPAPMVLETIQLAFAGAAGPVELHVWGDMGSAQPDEVDLTPPIVVDVEPLVWTAIDVSDRGIQLHPKDHFWIGYVHLAEEPLLLLDSGTRGNDYSKVRDPDIVAAPARWALPGNEYLLRVTGRTFCEVDRPMFADVSAAAGLASRTGSWVGWGDVDGDRDDDLLIDGSTLMRNDGGGVFTDVTDAAGLRPVVGLGGVGVLADVDGDADLDLFRGTYRQIDVDGDGLPPPPPQPGELPNTVFLNDGSGAFVPAPPSDVTTWDPTTSAAFGDFDADGRLDVLVTNWLWEWPWNPAAPDLLLRGNGDGTFTDVTAAAGLGDQGGPLNRLSYAVSAVDYDDDSDLDLFVSTYGHEPNFFWQNQHAQGADVFVDVAADVGLAEDESPPGGLTYGTAWGDVDGDGDLDAFLPEIAHPRALDFADVSSLQVNTGPPGHVFVDVTAGSGIDYEEGGIESSFADFDGDGDLDLFVSNVYPVQNGRLYRQEADGTFTDISYEAGVYREQVLGHAWADVDRDGDLDLAIANQAAGGHVWLFENRVGQDRRWLSVRLRGEGCGGAPGCNCTGVGARVSVTASGRTQVREVRAGRGHFGNQSSQPVEFGLGDADRIDALSVRWPCGVSESYSGAEVDRFVLVREGRSAVVLE